MFVLLIFCFFIQACVTGSPSNTIPGMVVNQADYHYKMGLTYIGEKNYTEALVQLAEADKLRPQNPEILHNLGLAYMGKNRIDLSIPYFVKAITLKPDYSQAKNDYGLALMKLGRYDEAIALFQVARDDLFFKNSENAGINIGIAYLEKGDNEKALKELRTLTKMNPRNPITKVHLGRAYFALGRYNQAIEEYNQALDLYQDYGAAYYYLGQVYMKVGDSPAAKESFRAVTKILPESSDLSQSAKEYLKLFR